MCSLYKYKNFAQSLNCEYNLLDTKMMVRMLEVKFLLRTESNLSKCLVYFPFIHGWKRQFLQALDGG